MSLDLFNNLVIQAQLSFMNSDNMDDLESIRVKFLGKKGYINQKIKILHSLDPKERPKLGLIINKTKKNIQKLFIERKKKLELNAITNSLNVDALDITLPGRSSTLGTFHPITNIVDRAKKFFNYLGFSEVHGPEIENDYFNFDALNIPVYHPSRDEHDTFWINSKYLLRTHTSGIQVRTMMHRIPPIRIISVGRVYRKDYDKSHTPMFHQIEGLMVDVNINFSNLKKILYDFLHYFFGKDIVLRFRPSYFPFTEPSAEIDIMMKQTTKTYNLLNLNKNWIELLGCGMIHPKVLFNVGINAEKFSGFAFGIGIERLAMLFYHITDIREFFENDLDFLKQF